MTAETRLLESPRPGAAPDPEDDVVVVNARAGTVVASSVDVVTRQIQAGFEAAGVPPPRVTPVEPDRLEDTLRREADRGRARVIVGGGDGTVAMAAATLSGTSTALGILPMGTFNLLARDLDIPLVLEEASSALATATPVAIDVAEVNGRPFLCACVLGFFPNVVLRRDAYRGRPWWHKTAAIVHATLRSFTDYPALLLRLVRDGGDDVHIRTRFVAVTNNPYAETVGLLPRKATLSGGTLSVYVTRYRGVHHLVLGSLAFVTGAFARDPRLDGHSCQRLRIEPRRHHRLRVMLDGEIVRLDRPLEFRLRPKSLYVLAPCRG